VARCAREAPHGPREREGPAREDVVDDPPPRPREKLTPGKVIVSVWFIVLGVIAVQAGVASTEYVNPIPEMLIAVGGIALIVAYVRVLRGGR
jgi:protein-S-isoprenylcysteine O-methyltransferase Ste14